MYDLWDDYSFYIISFIVAVVVIFFGYVLIKAVVKDGNNWKTFSKQHHCQLVAHTDGHMVYGFGGKYSQSYYVSGQDSFKCDNGVTYTRDN